MSDPISSPGRGKTIVCIEDDPVQQGIYQSLLTRRGYEVIACLTGAETLEKLRTIRPDLLIIDLHLPDITGLELCDALLNLSTTTNVPFLFVSSDDREGQITAGLQKGAMDYIVKPFQPSALLAKVSVALSRAALTRRHRETAQLIAGRYEVVNRLGSGGTSMVFHARDVKQVPPLEVALKLYDLGYMEMFGAADRRQRFLREAYQLSRMDHPNIVKLLDFGRTDDDRYFIAMEFVHGTTLQELLLTGRPLPEQELVFIGYEVAQTLQYLHGHQMVHRDLKPGNIMLTEHGAVKLIDFGLARRAVDRLASDNDFFAGTPVFVAPELIATEGETDIRSDLYSLGVTLYFAFSKNVPFAAASHTQVLQEKLAERIKPLGELRPELNPALSDLVMRLMAPEPAARPDVESVVRDLRELLAKYA